MSDSPKLTPQEAFECAATAQAMLMASMVKALASAGAVRLDTVQALLAADQLVHPHPAVQSLAAKMQRAMLLTLALTEKPAGQG